jgi:hypothetical protein
MTSEKRTLIEPVDITAIELECQTCECRTSIPIAGSGEPNRRIPYLCPGCGETLMIRDGDDHKALKELLDLIRHLPTRKLTFGLRFDVKGPDE